MAEQALEIRSSNSPSSPLSHGVKKNLEIGDGRGGTDGEGLGVQGRLPGRNAVWDLYRQEVRLLKQSHNTAKAW